MGASKPVVLSLRRYYPGQVQTVGSDYGRPLSLASPSSRQNTLVSLNHLTAYHRPRRPVNERMIAKQAL